MIVPLSLPGILSISVYVPFFHFRTESHPLFIGQIRQKTRYLSKPALYIFHNFSGFPL